MRVHQNGIWHTRPGSSAVSGLPKSQRRLAFYPGSSIGNFEPNDARTFLSSLRPLLGDGGALLIGVDLKKTPAILHAAYNDAAGITAEFNLNLLAHMRRELGAEVALANFRHRSREYTNVRTTKDLGIAARRSIIINYSRIDSFVVIWIRPVRLF